MFTPLHTRCTLCCTPIAGPYTLSGIDMAGTDITSLYTNSHLQCVGACMDNSRCQFAIRVTDGTCYLKAIPLTGPNGGNRLEAADVVICAYSARLTR